MRSKYKQYQGTKQNAQFGKTKIKYPAWCFSISLEKNPCKASFCFSHHAITSFMSVVQQLEHFGIYLSVSIILLSQVNLPKIRPPIHSILTRRKYIYILTSSFDKLILKTRCTRLHFSHDHFSTLLAKYSANTVVNCSLLFPHYFAHVSTTFL